MEDKEKEGYMEFELHKSVFDNDLRKLTQVLKTLKNNKEAIDKKVKKCMKFNFYDDLLTVNDNW